MKVTTPTLLALVLLEVGCHAGAPTASALKSTYEEFEQRARWSDAPAVSMMLGPERRSGFLAARARDQADVSISDIELQDVKSAPDGQTAWVTSQWRWIRLPSTTERVEIVRSTWVARGGDWLLESLEGGPYADLAPRK